MPSRRYCSVDEKIEIGRRLMEMKHLDPWGHFGPWLAEQAITAPVAHPSMLLALEADKMETPAALAT